MVGKPCVLTKKDVQFRKTTRLFQETSYKAGFRVPLGNTAQRLCDRCVVKFFRQMKQKAE